jgi:hypothetical protein
LIYLCNSGAVGGFFCEEEEEEEAEILGTFAKWRKSTISFVMSVRLSACQFVRMEQLGSH